MNSGLAPDQDDTVTIRLSSGQVLDLVNRIARQMGTQFDVFAEGRLNPACRVAIALIACRYREDITLEEMARAADMSVYHLMRRFRREVGITPTAFLRHYRITRAMRLLANTDRPVRRVALESGYKDAASFSRAFLKLAGMQPLRYRKMLRAEEQRLRQERNATSPIGRDEPARALDVPTMGLQVGVDVDSSSEAGAAI